MQVTFLGTGAAMPTGERSQTGLLLEDPDDGSDPLLVDCGSGAIHGLAATDVGYEGIVIPDHVPQVAGDTDWGHRSRSFTVGYLRAALEAVRRD